MKTSAETIHSVLKFQKHATDHLPIELRPDWLLLIHQQATGRTTPARVTHTMLVDHTEQDLNGATDKIWHRHWAWIIHGKNLQPLPTPIPISRLGRASGKNYGKGAQKFVYLADRDLLDLLKSGLIPASAWGSPVP